MGSDVSVVLHPDAAVPDVVMATQTSVHGGSADTEQRVVRRCPTLRVMNAAAATQLTGICSPPPAAPKVTTAEPHAGDRPALLIHGCAEMDAFTKAHTYVPVLRAIHAHLDHYHNNDHNSHHHPRQQSTTAPVKTLGGGTRAGAPAGSRPVCPIGLVFDPSLALGGRLGTGDERAACVQFLKLFFVHLVAALEFVRDPPEPSPSPGTAAADGGGGGGQRKEDDVQDASVAAAAAAASSSSTSTPPPRLVVLYVDLRSSQLDDAAARWFATAVVMRAVRRARPFMLVAARSAAAGIGSGSPSLPPLTSSNSAGAAAGGGGGSGDAFLNYYSPDVKADMIWASLQHVLLTDNDISVDGAKAVVTELLAEDAAQDVRLRQQGIDPKVQRAREVTEAMAAHRLNPRPDTKLLPQLYLVEVQRKTNVDQQVAEEEKEKDAQAAKTINENSRKQQKKKGLETAATANVQEPAALAASGHPPPLPSPAVSSMPPSPQSRAPQPTAPHVAAAAAAAAPSSSSPAPPPPTAQPAATRDVTKTPAASRTAKQFQQQQRAAAAPATAAKNKVPPQHTERRGQPPHQQQKHVQQVQQHSLPPSTAQSVDEDIAPSSSTPSLSAAAAAAVPATAASTRTSEQGPISPAAHAPTPTLPPHRGPQVRSSPAAFKGSAAAAAHASTPWESGPAPTHSPDPGRLSPVPHRTYYDTHRSAAEAEEGGWSKAKNNDDDDDVDGGGGAAAAMEDGPALPQLQRPSTGKTSPRVNVRAAPGAGTSPIRRTPEPTKRPAELPVAREAASIPPSAASPAAPPEPPAKKTGGGSSSRAKPQPDPLSMTTPNESTAATVPAQQAGLRKDDDRHETAPHTAPPVGPTQSHAAATQQTRSAGAKERPPAAVEPHPSTPRQQQLQQPQASKAPSAPVSPSAAAARKPKPMVPESGEEEGKPAADSAAAPPSPRYSQRSTPKPAAATPQQQRPGTAPRTRQLMAPPPQLASSTRRARGAGGGFMKKSPRKAGSRDPSPAAAAVVVDELRMPDVVVRGHSARRSPERSAVREGPPPYVVSPPVSARSPRQPQQQQQLAEPRLPVPIQQDYSSRGMGEGESGGVPRTRKSAAGPPVISPRGRRPSAPHRQVDEEAEMELPHHPSHHQHHSGGTADDEPWLDHVNPLETNSQHHHNNNSSGRPFMGAKSSGGYEEGAHTPRPGNRSPRSGRRRTFDITALDPPEPPYATAAAHVPPTMWEEGVRKRHPSPAQVAARKATGAERRASATSGRERRRRSSGFSSGAAGTDGHVVSPRKRSLLGTVDPVAEAKAAYEAATLAEARAKEQMERKREEQRQLQQKKPSSARPNGRASLRVEGEVQSVSETPLHRNAASTPVRVQTPQQQQQRSGAVEEEEGNTPSPAPNRPPGAHTPPSPRVPFTTTYADPSDPTGNADLDQSSFGAAPAPRKLNPYRRVSTATAPHITPRYTVTSRLRTVTSQRQRRVAEATAEIAGFYRSTAQPRRNFRGSEAFAALALPQPTREELRAVQADKERQYDRRYSMGGPVHSRHHGGNEDTSARLYSVDVNGSRRPSFAAGGTPSVSARGVRRETIHRDEAVSPPSREHSSRLHRAAAVPVSPRGVTAAAAPSTPPPRRGGQPNTAAYPRVQSPRQKGAAAAAMDEDEGRDRNNSSAVSLSPWGTGDGPASTPRRGRVGGAAPGSPAEVSAYGVPLVHNALRTQKR